MTANEPQKGLELANAALKQRQRENASKNEFKPAFSGVVFIPMKSNCTGCGVEMNYRGIKGRPELGPSICDTCEAALAEVERVEVERNKIKFTLRRTRIHSTYTEWDPEVARECGSAGHRAFIEAANLKRSLWIGTRENGTGKTHAVMHMGLRVAMDHNISVLAIDVSDWLVSMMQWKSGSDAQKKRFDQEKELAKNIDLLVMDDFGKERLSEAKAELLYNVINSLDRRKALAWVSTNKSGEQLRYRLNGGIHGMPEGRYVMEVSNGKTYLDFCFEHDHGNAILKRLKRMITPSNTRTD